MLTTYKIQRRGLAVLGVILVVIIGFNVTKLAAPTPHTPTLSWQKFSTGYGYEISYPVNSVSILPYKDRNNDKEQVFLFQVNNENEAAQSATAMRAWIWKRVMR